MLFSVLVKRTVPAGSKGTNWYRQDYTQHKVVVPGASRCLAKVAHPGCTSGDIADAFAGYSRQRVLQSASKLRQSGRVAHRCEGDTRRHFPRLTERAQEPEPQPVRETRPVRNFYVGTNDPRVILCLTRQAEELESRGLYRRAATVWMAAFRESHSQPERNNFLARRERCLRKSSKRAASGEEWYLSGNYVGA